MAPSGSELFAGGLGRLDKDGHWQPYNKQNTNGGLPGDSVSALTLGRTALSGSELETG